MITAMGSVSQTSNHSNIFNLASHACHEVTLAPLFTPKLLAPMALVASSLVGSVGLFSLFARTSHGPLIDMLSSKDSDHALSHLVEPDLPQLSNLIFRSLKLCTPASQKYNLQECDIKGPILDSMWLVQLIQNNVET